MFYTQSNISVTDSRSGEEPVSDENIDFEDVENDFENMFEIANMSQMLNVRGK